jgi:hypothetical protein
MADAPEAKARNIEVMGQELGAQYSELWQEIAYLHMKWGEYVSYMELSHRASFCSIKWHLFFLEWLSVRCGQTSCST